MWAQVLRAIGATLVSAVGSRRFTSADRLESGAEARQRRFCRHWQEYRALLVFLLLMAGFRSAWADWVYVPTGSMNPTILEGDRLLIDKHAFGLRVPFTRVHLTRGADPERGDIVTLDSPMDGTLLIKRVIAIPGDTVELDHERLIVNGVTASYSPGDVSELGELVRATRAHHPEVLQESGIGPSHDILLLPDRLAPSTYGPLVVPKGMYFLLGDDRDNSADSRYLGLVPRRNIIGRATRILFSLDPDHHDWPRRRRLLQPLH